MENLIELNFYEGEVIKFSNFRVEDKEYYKVDFNLTSSWLKVKLIYSGLIENLKNLIIEIDEILRQKREKTIITSELGNVYFEIIYDKIDGTFEIEGEISKTLTESTSVKINYKSDHYSLEQFKLRLEYILKSVLKME